MNTRSIHRAMAVLALCGATLAAGAAETPLERGRYLMQFIVACGNCHTPQGPNGPLVGMELAGGLRFEEPPFSAVAPNITPDKATGIGHWTDAQVVTAIRDRAAGPLRRMPLHTRRPGRA